MNTQIIKGLISNSSFESQVITEVNGIVFVNLDYFTNRSYQSQGINEFFFAISQYKNKPIVFLIRDGVNCWFTGIREIVKKVIKDLNCTKQNCFIYGYDDLQLEDVTFISLNVLQMWTDLTFKKIKDLPISSGNWQKKFAALYGRHDIFRLKFLRHLHTNYFEDSLLAFNSVTGTYNERFQNYFNEDIEWYKNNCPIFLDFKEANNWVPYDKSLSSIGEHYNKYFIEIVAETDFYSDKFFTEKTLKNFYLGKPFILWSGAHSLYKLREAGFRTFEPYINESYDRIENTKERFDAIMAEIDRLGKLPDHDLRSIHTKLEEIFSYNRDFFVQFMLTR
jgi:hypothetical protein